MLGPGMWFFFYIFPTDAAIGQAAEDMQSNVAGAKIGRISGLAFGSTALLSFMLARFGVRGIFDWSRPWRVAIFICLIAISMLGGFRSVLILNGLLFSVQFFLEGLHKSRLFPALLVAGVLTFAGLVPFAQKLPLSAQRALSILPIEVNAAARYDAQGSTEWRLKMWHALWPEVERHFWIGKGFTASAADYYLALESQRRGLSPDYETSLIAGDYHNGPLSIMVPFGIFGVLAFLFFVAASVRVLYLNYKNGHPALKLINTFLFSCFVVRVFFFMTVFGGIHGDIVLLVGLVGLSISLNGGIAPPNRMVSPAKKDSELPLGNDSEHLRLRRL
jgi:O-antigen ligase